MACHNGQPPAGERRDELFTIYVNNLPDELNQDGIAQIFQSYGQICDIFTPPNANWAYISYKTYREAEHAIRALNERSPLFLTVAFRKKKVQPKTQSCALNQESEMPVEQIEHRYSQNEPAHDLNSQRVTSESLANKVVQLSNESAMLVNNVHPIVSDQTNLFENSGRYIDTNAMWSRGVWRIDDFGKRYVSMGRGYTNYHIPEPEYAQIGYQVGRVYEKRRMGLYEFGNDRLQNKINICQNCDNWAQLQCDKCKAYYCSRPCQVRDWSRHQLECKAIPALVKEFDGASVSCSNIDESNLNRKPRGMVDVGPIAPLRRPRIPSIQMINSDDLDSRPTEMLDENVGKSKESVEALTAESKIFLKNNDERSNPIPSNLLTNNGKTDYLKLEKDLAFQRDPRVEINTRQLIPDSNGHVEHQTNSTNIEFPLKKTISKDKFEDVNVVYVSPDKTFWVIKREDIPEFETMMRELENKAGNYPRVTDLVTNKVYAVQYDGVWHRALVLMTKPIKLSYIDFGNVEAPQSNDFRSLENFTIYPSFAIHLRTSPNSKDDITQDCHLSVRMIGINDNGITEVVIRGKEPETQIPPTAQTINVEKKISPSILPMKQPSVFEKSINLPNVVESLKVNDHGCIQVVSCNEDKTYSACALISDLSQNYAQIFTKMTNVCNIASTACEHYIPKIGDFVCGKHGEDWLRGFVLSTDPEIRLALVDEARISPVEKVIPIPNGYENICSFGTIVTLETPKSNAFQNQNTAEFYITVIVNDGNEKTIEGIFSAPEDIKDVEFSMKSWKLPAEQKGMKFAELQNCSEVCISSYSSERIMYLRSLDATSMERNHRIIQNIAKWAQKAPKLDEPPAVGQLVIAKFADGNYYRAIVTKIVDGKIGVSYIDYGNSELTTIDQLRALSSELKEETSCTTKVILKGIKTGIPPTKEVHQYLDIMIGKEQSFICTFEGNPSKDGVTLTMINGECVNDKVNYYLTPGWEREDPSKNLDCFMVDDLEIMTLGKVGHVVKALPLHPTDPPFKYVMTPFDKEHITHVTQIMPELLLKYTQSTKSHYIPRASELCIAIWCDAWYRGVCLNPNASSTQALIYFVDYGNQAMVNYTDIRQMTKDFMSPPALGVLCAVKNLGIKLNNGKVPENVLERINELMPLNDLIDVKIIKSTSQEKSICGDYEIELPTVREILVAEGLAQP